jgi:hypothetical protein
VEQRHDPGARALALTLFLGFAASVLLVVLQTFPLAMLLPDGWPEAGSGGPALAAYLGIAAVHGVLWAILLAALPLAALPPGASRTARLAALLAGAAVAIALATGALANLAPGPAAVFSEMTVPVLMIVPHLVIATVLALRLPGPGRRAAGLAATAAAAALAAALPQGPGVLPLIAVVLALAATALRGAPGLARASAIALAAAWLLPFAADALPPLAEALAIPAPRERFAALGAALAGLPVPAQVYHPGGTVLALGLLAGLRAPGPVRRGMAWLAGLLAAAMALPEIGLGLGVTPLEPWAASVSLRSEVIALAPAVAGVACWAASVAAAPLMALMAGLLYLRAPRHS